MHALRQQIVAELVREGRHGAHGHHGHCQLGRELVLGRDVLLEPLAREGRLEPAEEQEAGRTPLA